MHRRNLRPQRSPSNRGGAPRGHLTSSSHERGANAQGWSSLRLSLIADGLCHCMRGQIRGPSTPNPMQRTAPAAKTGRPVAPLSRTVETGGHGSRQAINVKVACRCLAVRVHSRGVLSCACNRCLAGTCASEERIQVVSTAIFSCVRALRALRGDVFVKIVFLLVRYLPGPLQSWDADWLSALM